MDLYALPPEAFTAARDAAAKDDISLRALRRPTVSAWVVNILVRHESGLIDQLVELGAQLADAQQQGRGDALRELADQRRQLVASVADVAISLVARDVTPVVRTEVQQTLDAALSDPASAEAVRSGQLVRALSFAGFGGVDLEGAVAGLPRAAATRLDATRPAAPRPAAQAAEAKAHEAAGVLDEVARRAQLVSMALTRQEAELEQCVAAEQAANEQVASAQKALHEAEQTVKIVHGRRLAAQQQRDCLALKAIHLTGVVSSAQDAADAARSALDTIRRA